MRDVYPAHHATRSPPFTHELDKGNPEFVFHPHRPRESITPLYLFPFFVTYTTPLTVLQAPSVSCGDGLPFLHGSVFSGVFGCCLPQGGRLYAKEARSRR